MPPIYVRKEGHEDIWDDTLILKEYEEAMKIPKEEVAKRIANATNTGEKKKSQADGKKESQKTKKQFKVGDFCRATFEDDGVDYEAQIISVDKHNEKYLIRYIGYENEEYKHFSELLPTWGKKSRKEQKVEAKDSGKDNGAAAAAEPGCVLFERGKSSEFLNSKSLGIPASSSLFPPPPPMPPMLDESLEDAENLSAMLMSWYMSGYYTGLYQGQKLAQQKKGNR